MGTAQQIRDWALQLPLGDRASIARDLILSLDGDQVDTDAAAAWAQEIEARSEAYHRGEAQADDWQASLERARLRIREARGS